MELMHSHQSTLVVTFVVQNAIQMWKWSNLWVQLGSISSSNCWSHHVANSPASHCVHQTGNESRCGTMSNGDKQSSGSSRCRCREKKPVLLDESAIESRIVIWPPVGASGPACGGRQRPLGRSHWPQFATNSGLVCSGECR